MTFTNRIKTITQDAILPKETDNFLSESFLPFRVISNGDMWEGTDMKFPIKIAKNTQGQSFSGLDTHNTGTVQTRINFQYDLRAYNIPIAIPGLDKVVNKGESAILKVIKQEMGSTFMDALDDVSDMLYADGTGNSNKDFLGADALADDGTSVVTLGTLSRTTYPTLAGTRTASGGTLTTTKVSTLLTNVSAGSSARQRTTLLVTDKTTWDYCEKLFVSGTVQANYDSNGFPMVTRKSRGVMPAATLKGAQGFVAITYRGIPVIADEKATPTGTLWAFNENYLQWYGAKSDDLKSISMPKSIESAYSDQPTEDTGVQWSGFKDSFNQFGEVAYLYVLGNWTTRQPRRQGRLTGITGV